MNKTQPDLPSWSGGAFTGRDWLFLDEISLRPNELTPLAASHSTQTINECEVWWSAAAAALVQNNSPRRPTSCLDQVAVKCNTRPFMVCSSKFRSCFKDNKSEVRQQHQLLGEACFSSPTLTDVLFVSGNPGAASPLVVGRKLKRNQKVL